MRWKSTIPEKAAQWQEVIKDQERIAEIIEESDLTPEAKEELAKRIFLLFTEPGQYFVRGKASSEEQGTLKVDVNRKEVMEAVYEPKDGMLLTVDKSLGYDEETYTYVTEALGQEAANSLRDARSRWEKIASAAYRFGKEFFTATADPALEQQTVFELFIEAFEDPRNEEVAKAGAELAHEIYEGLGELWENQQFQGGLKVAGGVGAVVIVDPIAAAVSITGVGAIPAAVLATAATTYGIDQIATGFTQMLMNEEVPSIMVEAIKEVGFSPDVARNMDMYLAMGIPFAGSYKFLNFAGKSIKMGSSAIRRTAQQSVPMFFREGTCPRVVELTERELYTFKRPVNYGSILPQEEWQNFIGQAKNTIISEGEVLYGIRDIRSKNNWWTRNKPQGELQWRMDQAVLPEWNEGIFIEELIIPSGQSISGFEGIARQQSWFIGGGNQIYIPNVPKEWTKLKEWTKR